MQKFQFRFKAVSKVRRIEMERQAKALAAAQADVVRAKTEVAHLKQLIDEEVHRVQDLVHRGVFESQLLDLSQTYKKGLKFRIDEKIAQQKEFEKKVEQERLKLVEKEKRKKVFDKLEERERETYEEDLRKFECREMDEIVSSRWRSNT